MDEKKEELLPERTQFYYPAIYLGGVPAEIPSKKKKKWWKRTETISWSDFFQTEQNKMVVYRIIPHSNVSNNTRRLWKSIYKMYEMYESPGTRLERNGFKFTYREKDLFWFDVIFKQENGQKKIEFYISTSEYQAIKLKRKLENKMQVTIKEASLDQIRVPEKNTIVQDLKYLKHNIFSLNTNVNEQKTPIAAVMNTLDELQYDGDFARLSICNEAENRHKWIKNASWAYEKLSKGKVPQRATLNSKMILGASKKTLGGFVNEINFFITDLFNALSNTFFKSDKSYNKEKIINKPFSLEDEINARHISSASREKLNNPVFKSHIRIVAHSPDRLTRETIGETLSLSFSEITDNNELHSTKINIKSRKKEIINELNTLHLSNRTKLNGNVNLISTEEMSKLALQMPTVELQRRYEDALSIKKRTETAIPGVLCDSRGIHLGESELKDKKIPIYFPVKNPDELYRGYVFIGSQGNGKDTAIKNWIVDACLHHGISAIIPEVIVEEGERGMADGIRDALSSDKVIDIDLSDENYIVPMDLTEVILKLGKKGASRFADEVIDFFGDMEGMARTKRYLKTAAKASGGSLYNIKRIIEDEEYRLSKIEKLLQEGNKRLATELLNWGDNNELGSKADPVLNRLDDFFGNDTLFDIFSQDPKQEVDFAKWMKEGKVVIIRIPNRKLGELASRTLVHWVTLKTFMTRMLMSKEEQKNGCFMVFNEPEQYATEGLTKLMGRIGTEGRKERFGALYAFHHWNKLPMSLQENLKGGGVQQFLFANDHIKTFELSKHRLEPTITTEDASKLPRFHAIVSVRAGGDLQHAFICKMKPPVEKKYDNSELTKIHTKQCGRSWEQLQNERM
ncbi:ATP-binding protein [Bacillus pseudomycoides]|uniref:ATP-binding protein n=1 Tax=Bacillus pseudomycoides TaxID=64104 RepID=UPI000BF28EEB|nr:ATP-binding protein [Bacillus pseudomycoides]PGA76474.1 ATP-binding protein [Bacillus pseudomycoides]PHE92353.1 ATP-binding protein [Bacillus pseudomycoides]